MNTANQIKLQTNFPILYSRSNTVNPWKASKVFTPIEGFGLECGDGWFKLIYDLSEKIENYNNSLLPKNAIHKIWIKLGKTLMRRFKLRSFLFIPGEFVRVVQIKEKFGSLNFYVDNYVDCLEDLISKAESESETICEVCGKSGKLRDECGWYYTACDYHSKTSNK